MLVVKSRKQLVLNLREPERVTTIIPTAKVFQFKGQPLVAVPHRLDEVRVLKNLGFEPPSPISSYYGWPGMFRPFQHQRTTTEFLTENPRSFCLNGMGSGKTLSVLWAYDYLRSIGRVRKMLVISPLSTLERTWGDEIFKHFPHLNFAVVHGNAEKRLRLIDNDDFDIYIINHDGIKSTRTLEAIQMRNDIDVVTVDEIASFRNATTDRWKCLKTLVTKREFVWGLTGTPTPNEPTDSWAQIRLINPGAVPSYFGSFRDHLMRKVTQFKWVPRDGAMDLVYEAMQPAIRFSREDCIDLPPTLYQTYQVDMSPEQRRMYKAMLDKLHAELESGQITAANEAVKLNKLVQIACGVAYSNDGEAIAIPAPARLELVKDIIEEAGAKVIVFVPLTGVLEHLERELSKHFTVAVINGAVPKSKRDEVFRAFQQDKNPRVLIAQPAAMSHGLTLTAANTIVWYSAITSAEIYQQANARIVRPGQKLNTLIAHVEGSPVERALFDRLQHRGKMQGILLDMFKQ